MFRGKFRAWKCSWPYSGGSSYGDDQRVSMCLPGYHLNLVSVVAPDSQTPSSSSNHLARWLKPVTPSASATQQHQHSQRHSSKSSSSSSSKDPSWVFEFRYKCQQEVNQTNSD
eukprot:1137612-Pelagomonas_calceolata.AAC.4